MLFQQPCFLFHFSKAAQGYTMLVELKNGETYNGHLVNCDTWMNIHLREKICTSEVEFLLLSLGWQLLLENA
ncbi:sm-like protein LSM4 isoform X2 [Physcomitrium patens]|uniref:U6 snRNA-associated Sm-like protein LSm4 n=1 Tax=Physcomitrium patens TaxID=3218 RepID=A0A7I4C0H6_PHYPA